MKEEDRNTQSDTYKETPASRRLYMALIDPDNFDLTVTELCNKANVSRNTYYQRMKDDTFVARVKSEQRRQVESKIGNVLSATYKYALEERGHQDRKMLLTWAGEYADKFESKVDGTVDIGSASAVLQKYLKSGDDEVIQEPVDDRDGG